jgi:hypothetical protein
VSLIELRRSSRCEAVSRGVIADWDGREGGLIGNKLL